jgi:hypothetical protein
VQVAAQLGVQVPAASDQRAAVLRLELGEPGFAVLAPTPGMSVSVPASTAARTASSPSGRIAAAALR